MPGIIRSMHGFFRLTAFGGATICAIRVCGMALILATVAEAQESMTDGLRMAAVEGRAILVLPDGAVNPHVPAASAPMAVRTWETAERRYHAVEFEGETFTASTPLRGPRSRIVFDPARRTFSTLLPSVRVELQQGVQTEAIAAVVDATRITVFEALGFAIVDLPADVHPAEAISRLQRLPGPPRATLRLSAPRIEWR